MDHLLEHLCIPGRMPDRFLFQGCIVPALFTENMQNVHEHGLNDKTVVVIPVETVAVTVGSVTAVPSLKHLHGIIHARHVRVARMQHLKGSLDHG